jgi:hypothetical protein
MPVSYESSPGNTRGYCGNCGSTMFFRAEQFPNEVHFYAALLDHPENVEPSAHFHADEMLPWTHRRHQSPKEVGIVLA